MINPIEQQQEQDDDSELETLKRRRIRSLGEGDTGQDRFSDLPDCLIHHILSFMDTKYAVQTCALSRRWKNIWTSLPNLTFSRRNFRRNADFVNFVNKVLSLRDHTKVSSLRFGRSSCITASFFRKIVRYAMKHNVERLEIDVYTSVDLKLSNLIFTSKSLKTLIVKTLQDFRDLQEPLDLPALTDLHLESVSFSNSVHKSLDLFSKLLNLENLRLEYVHYPQAKSLNLFSNLLNLKNLYLGYSELRGLDAFTIFSPGLVSLTLSDFGYGCFANHDRLVVVVVSAPKLSTINFKGLPGKLLFEEKLSSLQKVEIRTNHVSESEKEKYAKRLITVLPELDSAKFATFLRP